MYSSYFSLNSLDDSVTSEASLVPILDSIFLHKKCAYFSNEDKKRIVTAYKTACSLHTWQYRENDQDYIIHIDRSLKIYIEDTLWKDEICNPDLLIALILHDCIEDSPDWLQEIIDTGIDITVLLHILWMSEPKIWVIEQVKKLRETNPFVYTEVSRQGFLNIYEIIEQNTPEKFVWSLQPSARLTENMTIRLKSLWYEYFSLKYSQLSDVMEQKKVYADFIFLCMIASMSREWFRLKGTERRDNMQDIEGLLKPEKVTSAQKTMMTSSEIYIPKAREIWEDILAQQLLWDILKERATFVNRWLIQERKWS